MASHPADPTTATDPRSGPASDPQLSTLDGLVLLAFSVHGLLERRAAEHDVSIAATRLLGILRDRRPTMNELAALLQLDKSSTTGLVTRAERRGLVTRVPSTSDRRSISVALTDTGWQLIAEVTARFGADIAALLAGLPIADRQTLTGLVSRVLVAGADARGIDLFPRTPPP